MASATDWPPTAELEDLSRDIVSVFDRMSALKGLAERLEEALDAPDGVWKQAVPSRDDFVSLAKFTATAEIDLREINTWLESLRSLVDHAATAMPWGGRDDG